MILAIIAGTTAALCAVSAIFFRASRGVDLKHRLAGSAHGLSMALLIWYGLIIEESGLTGSSNLLQLPAGLPWLAGPDVFLASCACERGIGVCALRQ